MCAVPDVLIVGGSLAGAATAIHLARAGRSVLLVERSLESTRKACGEGLSPLGVAELARLGLLSEIGPRGLELDGVSFHAGEHTATASFSGMDATPLGIQRTYLDQSLLDEARRIGVDVQTGVTVRSLSMQGDEVTSVQTDSGDLQAPVIVGADGLGSRMRRQAGLERGRTTARYGISAHIRVESLEAPQINVYFEDQHELYATPVAPGVTNVAILLHRAHMRGVAGDLLGGYRAMLDRHDAVFPRYELLDEPLAAGPFDVACTRPWRGNLVLVGDAAGFVDAISGEGMATALVSARHCAAAIDSYLERGDESAFRRYAGQRRALVRGSTLLARLALMLGSRNTLARWSVRNLARRPETFARLVAVNAGTLPLHALRPTDALALFLGV